MTDVLPAGVLGLRWLRRGNGAECLVALGTAWLVVLVGLPGNVGAQADTARDEQRADQVVLDGQVALARLIDLCAERLRLTLEYPAGDLNASVTLRLAGGLSDEDLWELTNQLLAVRGFAVIEGASPTTFHVVKLADAPAVAPVRVHRPEGAGDRGRVGGFETIVIDVTNRSSTKVAELIKPLLSRNGGAVSAIADTSLLVISDTSARLIEIERLVDTIDQPGAEPTVERIAPAHVSAAQLAPLVTSAMLTRDGIVGATTKGKLTPTQDGSSLLLVCPEVELERWTALIERFDQAEPVETRTYVPRSFPAADVAKLIESTMGDHVSGSGTAGGDQRWRVVVDDLTGALIITAAPSQHQRVAELLMRLDAAPVEARRPIRAFPVRNRNVRELAELLITLVEGGALDDAESARTAIHGGDASGSKADAHDRPAVTASTREAPTSSSTGTPSAADSTISSAGASGDRPRVVITADEPASAILAIGDPRTLQQIEELIVMLDTRQPQVMLEVLVISLSESDTRDLGVELEKLEVSGSTLIRLASLFGLGAVGLDAADAEPGGSGGTGVVLRPGDFRILIRALETINEGRALNIPKVLVNNNEQATLDAVLQQPFVSTNASDTVATTSFGGFENAGTSLSIRPQIAQGDHLILEYSVMLSAFVGDSADPSIPPPRQQNKLQSIVTIPDGYTVVLGGIEVISDTEAESRIPFLGSLPLVGGAFKSESKSASRSRFYVFISPAVLRHQSFEDLKYISGQEWLEADMDADGTRDDAIGWPDVEPQIIR